MKDGLRRCDGMTDLKKLQRKTMEDTRRRSGDGREDSTENEVTEDDDEGSGGRNLTAARVEGWLTATMVGGSARVWER
ncbi:uncharacterized protein G2W53_016015 [Senna tora]|uniref:Uncharacterized protein n=1 Tax=Senna tora TaxID=362788 RepID=A0A834WWT7_9FABA|nr:uncharacterized protein G2W53_016015 [Senna tora]